MFRAGSVIVELGLFCLFMCGSAFGQGYAPQVIGPQAYTQYPQYQVQQNGPQINVEYGVQQAPPVAQGWRGQNEREYNYSRRQPDFYHYHEHQWVPTQRYGNYCQQQPVCQPQYSYTPYYYGQQPSFYVPQQQQYRCW